MFNYDRSRPIIIPQKSKSSWEQVEVPPASAQWNDNLIGMSDIEFTANQLIHHIGIGVARVDQVHPILQAVALGLDLLQLLPMSGQCPAIIAPSQYSVGAKHGVSREQRQRSEEHTSELQSLMRNSYSV